MASMLRSRTRQTCALQAVLECHTAGLSRPSAHQQQDALAMSDSSNAAVTNETNVCPIGCVRVTDGRREQPPSAAAARCSHWAGRPPIDWPVWARTANYCCGTLSSLMTSHPVQPCQGMIPSTAAFCPQSSLSEIACHAQPTDLDSVSQDCQLLL